MLSGLLTGALGWLVRLVIIVIVIILVAIVAHALGGFNWEVHIGHLVWRLGVT